MIQLLYPAHECETGFSLSKFTYYVFSYWFETMAMFNVDFLTQAPNALSMSHERLSPKALLKFKAQNKNHHVHRACARLWAQGVSWPEAKKIVSEAFEATLTWT